MTRRMFKAGGEGSRGEVGFHTWFFFLPVKVKVITESIRVKGLGSICTSLGGLFSRHWLVSNPSGRLLAHLSVNEPLLCGGPVGMAASYCSQAWPEFRLWGHEIIQSELEASAPARRSCV